ncbi:unnamed protein product [Ilex paraguariensis]|uniref:Protein NO VEIN C-terminal domain-containing protein n=1 Tax=Ilex paraguariensis TaxID=185542 RepID=A0ABC8QUV8_9AQUA
MANSKQKIMEALRSGAFIFVPYSPGSTAEDVVPGVLLSRQEVYWHDSTGSMDQMKTIRPQNGPDLTNCPFSKMLCYVYPGLHDFFVNECGVEEAPPFRCYLQILMQLATVALPSQVAKTVFQVFLNWTEGLKHGLLSSEDVEYFKESLLKMQFKVLPTAQDKWVSLHPSFGFVCWGDDEKLKKEFKYHDNIDFLYFGDLSDEEKEMLLAKVSILMQRLGIPALSEVVTREAIYYGPADSDFKASLVNWALPYAQRYIYNVHPDKYLQCKQSAVENLSRLRIVVVEKLFYRNVIKSSDIASKKRFECSCLLQDNILYTTQESDSHSIFMELSDLLVDGVSGLHLANFLHMITTMAESGSSEEQTEFFILNSQKVQKLPNEELVWSLSSALSSTENGDILMTTSASTMVDEPNPSQAKRKPGINLNWPPVDWKTAPGFSYARANRLKTQACDSQQMGKGDEAEVVVAETDHMASIEINADWIVEDDPAGTTPAVTLQDPEISGDLSDRANNMAASDMNVVFDFVDLVTASDVPNSGSSNSIERDQLSFGTANAQQALLTGRLGEFVAFKYFVGKFGGTCVKWVNEAYETGLPYDIVIGDEEKSKEYIEVKATKSSRKNWSIISVREWQCAFEKGESFSIAHVVLSDNNVARVTIYKNPIRLCQLGKLQLAVLMPKQQKGTSIIS